MPGFSISIDAKIMKRWDERARQFKVSRSKALEYMMRAVLKETDQTKQAKETKECQT